MSFVSSMFPLLRLLLPTHKFCSNTRHFAQSMHPCQTTVWISCWTLFSWHGCFVAVWYFQTSFNRKYYIVLVRSVTRVWSHDTLDQIRFYAEKRYIKTLIRLNGVFTANTLRCIWYANGGKWNQESTSRPFDWPSRRRDKSRVKMCAWRN